MIRAEKLGIRPSPEEVDRWFVPPEDEYGGGGGSSGGGAPGVGGGTRGEGDEEFERVVVGRSVGGRELVLYRLVVSSSPGRSTGGSGGGGGGGGTLTEKKRTAVLFQSLVHGNEPLGLVALLRTAEELLRPRARNRHLRALKRLAASSPSSSSSDGAGAAELELLFFPVVNVDAYVLNLEYNAGCRRANLGRNDTTCSPRISSGEPCLGGVDLNRNFDLDFRPPSGLEDPCGLAGGANYQGPEPFSEPESRVVRDVVLKYRPQAVMSYHSRRSSGQALLIRPYSSGTRTLTASGTEKFDAWTRIMSSHRRNLYVTGNAQDTVGYTASGVAIDWMLAVGNVSFPFVHESGTPCRDRWCEDEWRGTIRDDARVYAEAGARMVDLALGAEEVNHWLSPLLALLVVVAGVVVVRMGEGGRGGRAPARCPKRFSLASACGAIRRSSKQRRRSSKGDKYDEGDIGDIQRSVEMRRLLSSSKP